MVKSTKNRTKKSTIVPKKGTKKAKKRVQKTVTVKATGVHSLLRDLPWDDDDYSDRFSDEFAAPRDRSLWDVANDLESRIFRLETVKEVAHMCAENTHNAQQSSAMWMVGDHIGYVIKELEELKDEVMAFNGKLRESL